MRGRLLFDSDADAGPGLGDKCIGRARAAARTAKREPKADRNGEGDSETDCQDPGEHARYASYFPLRNAPVRMESLDGGSSQCLIPKRSTGNQ